MSLNLSLFYNNVHYPHNPVSGMQWQSQQEIDDFVVSLQQQEQAAAQPPAPIPRTSRGFIPATRNQFFSLFTNAQVNAIKKRANLPENHADYDADLEALWVRLNMTDAIEYDNFMVQAGFDKLILLGFIDQPYQDAIEELWPREVIESWKDKHPGTGMPLRTFPFVEARAAQIRGS